jgi:hypothetical protein
MDFNRWGLVGGLQFRKPRGGSSEMTVVVVEWREVNLSGFRGGGTKGHWFGNALDSLSAVIHSIRDTQWPSLLSKLESSSLNVEIIDKRGMFFLCMWLFVVLSSLFVNILRSGSFENYALLKSWRYWILMLDAGFCAMAPEQSHHYK